MIRVLIADDHPVFRDGLQAALSDEPEVEVIGQVADGEQAVQRAVAELPDVVLMDLNMPGLGGIEATRRLAAEAPGTGTLVLTMFDDDESVFAAMRAGARGYLLKGADQDDILRAIRTVASGDVVFGAGVATRVLGFFAAGGRVGARAGRPFPQLTERETEILELMAQGLNNNAISRRLVVSDKTVRNHVSNVFAKLQVADRAQAIVRAREAGLGGS